MGRRPGHTGRDAAATGGTSASLLKSRRDQREVTTLRLPPRELEVASSIYFAADVGRESYRQLGSRGRRCA